MAGITHEFKENCYIGLGNPCRQVWRSSFRILIDYRNRVLKKKTRLQVTFCSAGEREQGNASVCIQLDHYKKESLLEKKLTKLVSMI